MVGCGGSPPRDPSVYDWSDHFTQDSFPHRMRFLTERMIHETLANGNDCDRVEAGAGKLRRRKTYDGVDAVLVLPEYEAYVVTGWTEISDYATALASARWTQDQLQTMQAFQDHEHKHWRMQRTARPSRGNP